MDTTDPRAFLPATTPHDAPTAPTALISVEISTLDEHGDPGFVHGRGHFHFHSSSTTARFAVVQAYTIADLREADVVAVTLTQHVDDSVCLVGTPGEIACALAAIPLYAPGVRSAELPAPRYVTDTVLAHTDRLRVSGTDPDTPTVDVLVRSVQPDPLPDALTVAGDVPAATARAYAESLAREITAASRGTSEAAVVALPGQSRLMVVHALTVSDTDDAAVDRYTRITQLRANIAALDPVADAECAVGLTAELHVLESHTRRSFDDESGAVA
ncbi:methyltransferase [Rhodococcus sp. NPDC080181]|uniref:methyltransferase n=1 Tax=Rhodococcus sp. NPDC080181 TaxID=3155292 RepID=UPI00344B3749